MVSSMSHPGVLARRKVVGVVDNDPSMLKALERLLTAHGFVVEPYVSAEAFLDGAAEDELTCLVLDIHLGGMSGIQLCRQLSASGCKFPVIFVTAFDNPDTHHGRWTRAKPPPPCCGGGTRGAPDKRFAGLYHRTMHLSAIHQMQS
jgi:CheY-like chemotaxis protein